MTDLDSKLQALHDEHCCWVKSCEVRYLLRAAADLALESCLAVVKEHRHQVRRGVDTYADANNDCVTRTSVAIRALRTRGGER